MADVDCELPISSLNEIYSDELLAGVVQHGIAKDSAFVAVVGLLGALNNYLPGDFTTLAEGAVFPHIGLAAELPGLTLETSANQMATGRASITLFDDIQLTAFGHIPTVGSVSATFNGPHLSAAASTQIIGRLSDALTGFLLAASDEHVDYLDGRLPSFTLEATLEPVSVPVSAEFAGTGPEPQLEIHGYFHDYELGAEGYVTVVFHPDQRAVTTYTTQFNSYARRNGKVYCGSPDGLWLREGQNDGEDIIVSRIVKTGITMDTPLRKRFTTLYAHGKFADGYEIKVETEGAEGTVQVADSVTYLHGSKAKLPRGLTGETLSFDLTARDSIEIDNMVFEAELSATRRGRQTG